MLTNKSAAAPYPPMAIKEAHWAQTYPARGRPAARGSLSTVRPVGPTCGSTKWVIHPARAGQRERGQAGVGSGSAGQAASRDAGNRRTDWHWRDPRLPPDPTRHPRRPVATLAARQQHAIPAFRFQARFAGISEKVNLNSFIAVR